MGGKKLFADLHTELLCRIIYYANLRTNTGLQSGSRSHRRLGSRAPRIMREYDLAIAISIQPLIQPFMCEMSSSIFAAMSRLIFMSTTRNSLPSMPSTERMNGEKCFCFSWQCLPCLYLLILSHRTRSVTIGSNL